MGKINVDGTEIQILQIEEDDYISLTDMVRKIDNGPALIEKWLRNKNTIEFLGIWEEMYNEDFDTNAYDEIMQEAGLNRFIMSVKQWVSRTNSKGIVAKAGRYGGTYAYKDIAFEFASWVSPQFKLYLIKEFERLKKEEQALLGWSAKRELAKINYRIHTDAIKTNLIPAELTAQQTSVIYASAIPYSLSANRAPSFACKSPGFLRSTSDIGIRKELHKEKQALSGNPFAQS